MSIVIQLAIVVIQCIMFSRNILVLLCVVLKGEIEAIGVDHEDADSAEAIGVDHEDADAAEAVRSGHEAADVTEAVRFGHDAADVTDAVGLDLQATEIGLNAEAGEVLLEFGLEAGTNGEEEGEYYEHDDDDNYDQDDIYENDEDDIYEDDNDADEQDDIYDSDTNDDNDQVDIYDNDDEDDYIFIINDDKEYTESSAGQKYEEHDEDYHPEERLSPRVVHLAGTETDSSSFFSSFTTYLGAFAVLIVLAMAWVMAKETRESRGPKLKSQCKTEAEFGPKTQLKLIFNTRINREKAAEAGENV